MDDVPTRYPAVRNVLAPPYAELSDEALESVVPQLFGGVRATEAEDWLSAIGSGLSSAASQVGRVVSSPRGQQILAGAGSGGLAAAGGGPYAALFGAALGAAGAALAPEPGLPPQQRAARQPQQPARSRMQGPPAPTPAQRVQQAEPYTPPARWLPGAQPAPQASGPQAWSAEPAGPVPHGTAVNALQLALSRPEMQQALVQLALGAAGSGKVDTGGFEVPTAAFGHLLGALANQAAAEFTEAEVHTQRAGEAEADDSYVAVRPGADPVNPQDRASALNTLLASLQQPVTVAEPPAEPVGIPAGVAQWPVQPPGAAPQPPADPAGGASQPAEQPARSDHRRRRPRRFAQYEAEAAAAEAAAAETADLETAAWYEYLRVASS